MSFQHCAKFQKKLRIQFQENAWTEGWTEGLTDPILQDPSGYRWRFKRDVYNAKIKDIEDKIVDFTNLATNNASLDGKINVLENEIPSITNLATTTTTALADVGNKIPNVSDLVKKQIMMQKKYIY